jgi:hypothetical protein
MAIDTAQLSAAHTEIQSQQRMCLIGELLYFQGAL